MGVGADSVFSVSAGMTARSQGELLSELDPKNKPTVYSSHVVTGLAARCDIRTTAGTTPPRGAYGTVFGQDEAAVAAWCRARGSHWLDDSSRCMAGPGSTDAPLAFGFCGDKLCKIDVVVHLNPTRPQHGRWPVEMARASADLVKRYGLPSAQNVQRPRACMDERLLSCVAASRASYTYQWKWPAGESIWLLLTSDRGRPALRVVYTAAPRASERPEQPQVWQSKSRQHTLPAPAA